MIIIVVIGARSLVGAYLCLVDQTLCNTGASVSTHAEGSGESGQLFVNSVDLGRPIKSQYLFDKCVMTLLKGGNRLH